MIETIITTVLTSSLLIGLVTYLAKKLFENYLSQRSKIYIEEKSLEHKKSFHKYSKIFDQQADFYVKTFRDLTHISDENSYLSLAFNIKEKVDPQGSKTEDDAEVMDRIRKLINPENHEEQKAKELSDFIQKSYKEFRQNKIFFDIELAEQIKKYYELTLFTSSHFNDINYRDPKTNKSVVNPRVITAWKSSTEAAPIIIAEIESNFRKLLTV